MNRAHVFPKPKPPAPRWKLRGRCGACGHVAVFSRFRYTDGSVSSTRDCPACGESAPLGLAVVA